MRFWKADLYDQVFSTGGFKLQEVKGMSLIRDEEEGNWYEA
jgi:hypothetical protein